MKNYKDILYTSRFLILFTLLALSIIGVSATRILNNRQDDIQKRLEQVIETTDITDLRITNKTSAFNIIHIEKLPDGNIYLKLQNGYKKSITAYQVSIGNDKTLVDSVLSIHDESVAPGSFKNEFLAFNVDPDLRSKGIVILSVVFDDGTADGSAQSIAEIQDYRLGEQKQIEHLGSFLNSNSTLSTRDHLDVIRDMEANMLSVSEDTGTEFPKYVQFGILDTKQRLSRQIEEIIAQRDEKTEKRFAAFSEYLKEKALTLGKYSEAIKNKAQ